MSKKVYLKTWGCQMNVHDSEKMLGILEREGYTEIENPRKADLIIFNTCSVREKAEHKFFSELGRLKSYKRRNSKVKIIVAGCIAQLEGKDILKRAPYVDFIFGPQNIDKLTDILNNENKPIFLEDNPYITSINLPIKRDTKVKAWVTIMYGCNNFCSYCVVPYARGRERSRPSADIYSEVSELANKGYKEVTLLGQNVNSYRNDIDFPELLKKLNNIEGIERIRFVTSHPKDLSDKLIDSIASLSKVCEHIHLPLQSGSNKILKLMNRGYKYEEYLEKIYKLRDKIPDISITSDIISGFPGETEEDHNYTINALKEIKFDGIFAFKYSPRPKTKASKLEDNISNIEKSKRLSEILNLQDEITLQVNRSLEGKKLEVLIEGTSEKNNNKLTGRTRTNKIVNIHKGNLKKGELVLVEIIKARKHSLEGKIINNEGISSYSRM